MDDYRGAYTPFSWGSNGTWAWKMLVHIIALYIDLPKASRLEARNLMRGTPG